MKFMAYNLGPPPAEKIDNPNPPTPDPGPPPAQKIYNPNDLVLVLVLVLLSSPHGKAGSAGNKIFIKISEKFSRNFSRSVTVFF